jgi:thiol-disulfide isomerase/thioredoxin
MTHCARLVFAVALFGGMTLCLSEGAPARQEKTAAIRVEKIKYADLGKLVHSHMGKVVIVDFWADFCIPCKREFPHLVALHNKHKDDGFVAVAVALDDPKDTAARDRIIAFLGKNNAGGLTNLQLDETPDVWQQKLAISGPPCVYVFDREGRIAGKWDDQVNYEEIEKKVAELMKK